MLRRCFSSGSAINLPPSKSAPFNARALKKRKTKQFFFKNGYICRLPFDSNENESVTVKSFIEFLTGVFFILFFVQENKQLFINLFCSRRG